MLSPSLARLVELGARLAENGDASLLDARLDRLAREVEDDCAADALRAIHEAAEAGTLRDLLAPGRLERWANEVATLREESAMRAQLQRWLEGAGQLHDAPERLVSVPSPPAEREALRAWAREHEVEALLDEDARVHALDAADLPEGLTLEDACLAGAARPRPRRRRPAEGPVAASDADPLRTWRIAEEARAALRRAATTLAAGVRREALHRGTPAPDVAALVQRLRGLASPGMLRELDALRFVPTSPVRFDSDSGVCRGTLRDPGAAGAIDVRLDLSGYEQRPVRGTCSACHAPDAAACGHLRALAARLLDACLEPTDRLHAPVREFVREPSWKRFLRALDVEPTPSHPVARHVRFVVAVSASTIEVTTKEPARRLLRGTGLAASDRRALEAMAMLSRTASTKTVRADVSLLRALVEAAQVVLRDDDAPLYVRESAVTVRWRELPEGLVPGVSLGVHEVTSAHAWRDVGCLVLFDEVGRTLHFGALAPRVARLLDALRTFHGALPEESYAALAPFVESLRDVAKVEAPAALRGVAREAPRRLLLRFEPAPGDGLDVSLCTRPLPLSPPWSPGRGPVIVHGLDAGVQVYCRRDLDHERSLAEQALAALELGRHPRIDADTHRVETKEGALDLLSRAARLGALVTIEWGEHTRKLQLGTTLRASALTVDVVKRGRWLALGGGVHAPEGDVAIGKLLDAARRGTRFVAVDGTTQLEIEAELFDRLELMQLCTLDGKRASIDALGLLERALPALTTSDDETRAWLGAHRQPTTDRDADIDALPYLRDYQRAGVRFLVARSAWAHGACLADEMGLGKTAQAVALLTLRHALGPALVVAPTSVVSGWLAELARFAPSLSVHPVTDGSDATQLGSLGPGDVVVTSFDLLVRHLEAFRRSRYATQVVDEAQTLRNATTRRAKAAREVDADFRVALSGTPIENRLSDLWSLFELVAPGLFGSFARFRARYAVPIERYGSPTRMQALQSLIAPFVLRRTKDEVARELPSRIELVRRVEASPAERQLYEAAVRRAQRALGKKRAGVDRETFSVLAELTHLRQLACHPRLVLPDSRVESSKLAAVLEWLRDLLPRGHRVLVFSQFTRHLDLVEEALGRAGVSMLRLDGATPAKERAATVAAFGRGEAQVFLISLKAGGTGLNLTAAEYVVHLDPWWNPAAEDQASDRAHRIGQTRPVTIVKFVTADTIEERVLELHSSKRRLATDVLGQADGGASRDEAGLSRMLLDEVRALAPSRRTPVS